VILVDSSVWIDFLNEKYARHVSNLYASSTSVARNFPHPKKLRPARGAARRGRLFELGAP